MIRLAALLALAVVLAFSYAQTVIIGLSRVPSMWTGTLTQPQAIISSSVDVYRVNFTLYDTNGTTVLWYNDEYRTKLGDVASKITDARWCLNGKKDTGWNASNVRALTQTSRCNDFDSRMLPDTAANSYKLLVTAYKTDGTTALYRKPFLVKNYARDDTNADVEYVAVGGTCVIKATCNRATPYGVIQEAINDATASTIIVVQPGTYRESLTLGVGATLVGQMGAIVDGSDSLGGTWTADGDDYYNTSYASFWKGYTSTGTVGSYGSPSGGGSGNCRDTTNKPCAANDFIILKNNSTGTLTYLQNQAYNSTGGAGTKPTIDDSKWWYGVSNRLYIDFPAATVASDYTIYYAHREKLLTLSATSATVRGLTFQYSTRAYNADGGTVEGHQYGQIHVTGSSNLIENVVSRYSRWAGIANQGSGTIIRASKLINNRVIGYTGAGDSALYQSNEIAGNNNFPLTETATGRLNQSSWSNTNSHLWRSGFEAGGGKSSGGSSGNKIQHNAFIYNHVHNNGGPGLWPDFHHTDLLIYRNRVYNNAWNGLDIEGLDGKEETTGTLNQFTLVRENVAYENGYDYSWAGEEPVGGEAGGQFDPPDWNGGANIYIRTSDLVDVYYNLSAWGGDGFGGVWESSRMGGACPDYVTFLQNVNIQHNHNIGDNVNNVHSYIAIDSSACNEASFEATSSFGAHPKIRTVGERIWFEQGSFSGGATAGPTFQNLTFGQNNGAGADDACWFKDAVSFKATWFSSAPVNCTFGSGTVEITSGERDTWLRDHGIPLSAFARPTSGPY